MLKDYAVAERVRGLLERHAATGGAPDEKRRGGHFDGVERTPGAGIGRLPDGAQEDHEPAVLRRHERPDHEPSVRPPRGGGVRRHVRSLLTRAAVRVPVRLDPGRRAAVAIGLAVLVAALVTGGWLLAARPRALPVSASSPIDGTSPRGSAAAGSGVAGASAPAAAGSGGAPESPVAPSPSAPAADVVVDVAGKVQHPGVYHLPPQSRVSDAVAAAGGPRHGVDLTSVNLAAKVSDGQQIVVGLPGVAPAAGAAAADASTGAAAGSADGTAAAGPVDLNTATLQQLESLPGIGPALGQRILDWRASHGSFSSVGQLTDVSGIGDARLADLKPRVRV